MRVLLFMLFLARGFCDYCYYIKFSTILQSSIMWPIYQSHASTWSTVLFSYEHICLECSSFIAFPLSENIYYIKLDPKFIFKTLFLSRLSSMAISLAQMKTNPSVLWKKKPLNLCAWSYHATLSLSPTLLVSLIFLQLNYQNLNLAISIYWRIRALITMITIFPIWILGLKSFHYTNILVPHY